MIYEINLNSSVMVIPLVQIVKTILMSNNLGAI